MAKIDLSKYGISGTTEIVHNPSYELLFEEETQAGLEGFEKGQVSELGAVNVMTGVYTGRSPKDKFIVMDENSKDTVWWTSDEYKNDNHPASEETWAAVKDIAVKELCDKKLYVVDAFCGANKDTRMAIRFIMEVAWQAHFVENMFIMPTAEELESFEPDFVVYNASKAKVENYKELGLNSETAVVFNITSREADHLIMEALREDISSEDVTTNAVMKEAVPGEVDLICKQDGIIAGLLVFRRVFELLDEKVETELYCKDGDMVSSGQLMGKVRGDIRVLLSGERVALNYLQRMSGIATYTHSVASLLEGSNTKLLDTRKTTPNMRIFEKYAVRVGGGYNHRYNLSDGVLLKDNHIGAAGSVTKAVQMAKEYAPFVRKIEVEVENLEMVKEAVEAGADIIMLDNMSTEEMQEAIRLIDGRAETECSGNVTRENIGRLTSLGVDYISSGALTHSAPIMDISLKNLHVVL